MAENKDYNFDNFDDTKAYGKHFKAQPQDEDNFDVEQNRTADVANEPAQANDYGDDFYSDKDSFEPDDDESTKVFDPVYTESTKKSKNDQRQRSHPRRFPSERR